MPGDLPKGFLEMAGGTDPAWLIAGLFLVESSGLEVLRRAG